MALIHAAYGVLTSTLYAQEVFTHFILGQDFLDIQYSQELFRKSGQNASVQGRLFLHLGQAEFKRGGGVIVYREASLFV